MRAPSRSLGVVCACALLALASPSKAISQEPAQRPPAFRAGTRVVPVDVRVVDKNGKPVTDLTRADFTILEDGVRQDVRHFFAEGLSAEPPSGNARVLRQALPSLGIAPQGH